MHRSGARAAGFSSGSGAGAAGPRTLYTQVVADLAAAAAQHAGSRPLESVNLPSILVTTLLALDTIHPTLAIAIGGAVLLLVLNAVGWRATSAMFDRERLITGTR